MDTKVYCLDPVTIINPKLTEFVMNSARIMWIDNQGSMHYDFNIYDKGTRTFVSYKAYVKKAIIGLIRSKESPTSNIKVVGLFNEDGEYMDAYIQVPCGHCVLCTERKRKSFAAKCILESQQHEYLPLFLTMTYDPEHLPEKGVNYRDVQLFLKKVRIRLKRLGYDVKLRYAVGAEYGDPNKTFRAHYHMLIWGFPRTGMFWNLNNVWHHLYDCWTDSNGVHKCISKCFILKQCSDSNAAYYVGKYMGKETKVPEGCNAPMHRTSINLGVDFFKSVAENILWNNPEQSDLKYCDKFTGALRRLPTVKYFINKVFPSHTIIPLEYRDAIDSYENAVKKLASLPKFTLEDRVRIINSNDEEGYAQLLAFETFTAEKCAAEEIMEKYANKQFPRYDDLKRERYFIHLMDNLSDIDLEHEVYKIIKQQAKDKDKEVF